MYVPWIYLITCSLIIVVKKKSSPISLGQFVTWFV